MKLQISQVEGRLAPNSANGSTQVVEEIPRRVAAASARVGAGDGVMVSSRGVEPRHQGLISRLLEQKQARRRGQRRAASRGQASSLPLRTPLASSSAPGLLCSWFPAA